MEALCHTWLISPSLLTVHKLARFYLFLFWLSDRTYLRNSGFLPQTQPHSGYILPQRHQRLFLKCASHGPTSTFLCEPLPQYPTWWRIACPFSFPKANKVYQIRVCQDLCALAKFVLTKNAFLRLIHKYICWWQVQPLAWKWPLHMPLYLCICWKQRFWLLQLALFHWWSLVVMDSREGETSQFHPTSQSEPSCHKILKSKRLNNHYWYLRQTDRHTPVPRDCSSAIRGRPCALLLPRGRPAP
jgi:hypothetical protein